LRERFGLRATWIHMVDEAVPTEKGLSNGERKDVEEMTQKSEKVSEEKDAPPKRFMSHDHPVWFLEAWRLICRPPRSQYTALHLGPPRLRVLLPTGPKTQRRSSPFLRKDLQLRNPRGHLLECSHFQPAATDNEQKLPCVIFCHGSSSCRMDAFQVMPWLLQYKVTLFCFDFAGSGLSGGDYVTLGRHEEEDILTVINYIVHNNLASSIGLWGKSMGAVASLFRASKDRRIDACVLDSPFADFRQVVLQTLSSMDHLQWLPTPAIDLCLSVIANDVQQRVGFDPRDLQPIIDAPKCLCSAFFGCAEKDTLVPPAQVQALQKAWGGPSEIMIFEGDHNCERPGNFLESASRFMWEALNAAADTDARISGAVEAFERKHFHERSKSAIRGSNLSHSQEDALLRTAVNSYVDQRHGMEMAIDAFVSLGGNSNVAANLTPQKHSKLMPGLPMMPKQPLVEKWELGNDAASKEACNLGEPIPSDGDDGVFAL